MCERGPYQLRGRAYVLPPDNYEARPWMNVNCSKKACSAFRGLFELRSSPAQSKTAPKMRKVYSLV